MRAAAGGERIVGVEHERLDGLACNRPFRSRRGDQSHTTAVLAGGVDRLDDGRVDATNADAIHRHRLAPRNGAEDRQLRRSVRATQIVRGISLGVSLALRVA